MVASGLGWFRYPAYWLYGEGWATFTAACALEFIASVAMYILCLRILKKIISPVNANSKQKPTMLNTIMRIMLESTVLVEYDDDDVYPVPVNEMYALLDVGVTRTHTGS
mmetsp:Transcript_33407/g.38364  ORF Transcript_33407/g.38364 Transcript_33407/m.38364 type:complete len:109 (-) Transcript_33407:613-939(-)